ncbi:AAA family ATPase [Candidatus Alkanophaga liquidiphilum]
MLEDLREVILEHIRNGKDPLDVIIGQRDAKRKIISSLLAGHHILIEGYPGVGKTTLAKHIAELLPEIEVVKGCPYHCDPKEPVCPLCRAMKERGETLETEKISGIKRFVRIQGSPDLTAEDLLGDIDPTKAFKYGPQDYRAFTPGKLLKGNRGIVFFDELNRVPEKLQNALLQVLEEGIATIGPYDVDYPSNFIMIATMNPRERAGVEELSDVLLDRFDVTKMGYPETEEEDKEIILRNAKQLESVEVPGKVLDAIVKLVRATREPPWSEELEQGASARAAISLYEKVQAAALLDGRNVATLDDVREMAFSSVVGRIKPAAGSKYYDDPEGLLREIVDSMLSELV